MTGPRTGVSSRITDRSPVRDLRCLGPAVVRRSQAVSVAQTQFPETSAVFSPDGRWIAYTSEGGQPNVYVQPFPGDGGKYQVSRNGGSHPTWRADGKELFYLSADGMMMAVPIEATSHFDPGVAQALFKTDVVRASVGRQYAVTKDGKRFLITRRHQALEPPVLTVVFDWSASVQK